MKKIIVAVDFSAASINAANYAVDLAHDVNVDILLMHVISVPIAISEVPVPPDTFDIMTEDAENEIDKLKNELRSRTNDKVTITGTVSFGGIIDEIRDTATFGDTLAVVMGINGAGATTELLFGSNTLAAIDGLLFPVIIVPSHAIYQKIIKTGLACDMLHVDETVPVKKIGTFTRLLNSQLHILHISKEAENSTMLPESVTLQNSLIDLHPVFHYLVNSDVEKGVASFVKDEHIDLLFVIPKERSFFDRLFHKSVSKEIAMRLPIPMMMLHK